jgi:preprotein translocase subunit SecE
VAEKDRKGRKPNYFQSIYRETVGELRKVSWPTWPEAYRLTGLVLLVMLIMGAILGSVDGLAQRGVARLLGIN